MLHQFATGGRAAVHGATRRRSRTAPRPHGAVASAPTPSAQPDSNINITMKCLHLGTRTFHSCFPPTRTTRLRGATHNPRGSATQRRKAHVLQGSCQLLRVPSTPTLTPASSTHQSHASPTHASVFLAFLLARPHLALSSQNLWLASFETSQRNFTVTPAWNDGRCGTCAKGDWS